MVNVVSSDVRSRAAVNSTGASPWLKVSPWNIAKGTSAKVSHQDSVTLTRRPEGKLHVDFAKLPMESQVDYCKQVYRKCDRASDSQTGKAVGLTVLGSIGIAAWAAALVPPLMLAASAVAYISGFVMSSKSDPNPYRDLISAMKKCSPEAQKSVIIEIMGESPEMANYLKTTLNVH